MPILIARNWWSWVVRGLVAILFGLATLTWPGITLAALVLLFGAYAFVDGVMAIVRMFRAPVAFERWVVLLLEGIAGILAGIVTVFWPGITALSLVILIAAWALVTGAFKIAAAIRLRRHLTHEWFLALSGAASLILGVVFLLVPLAGALAISLYIGLYAVVIGVLMMALGFRLRRWEHGPHTGMGEPLPSH